MKTLLFALNSKYIHTNLAVRYLSEMSLKNGYTPANGTAIEIAEYTINHRLPVILDEIFRRKPDVIFLSCYIWNIEMMLDFACEYKKISPDTILIAGGPEVSYNCHEVLASHKEFDGVLCGEGETAFLEFLEYLYDKRDIKAVSGLFYKNNAGTICQNPLPAPLSLDSLPFPYSNLESGELDNKIIYFETIRGCPFRCSYCLSSVTGGVRFMSPELSLPRLQRFLDAKVPQVKFVDRTFNCSKIHAMTIWKYLSEHDNGITNFHFELTAHLIDDEIISFLKTVRPGLFQFEIGVQSTNPETIKHIKRTTDTEKLLSICRELDKPKNIHLHLDLIAGLPYEGFDSFGHSFDTVMATRPQQMQMGFLKVLKGSHMADCTKEYGLVYSDKAPFQVIKTNWLSYEEMLILKDTENIVETYYNSGRFKFSLEFIMQKEPSLFQFFVLFGKYYVSKKYHLTPQSEDEKYTILRDFFLTRSPENKNILPLFHDICLYDICLHGKPKKLPDWISTAANISHRDDIRKIWDRPDLTKKNAKLAHVQYFNYDLLDFKPRNYALLFSYANGVKICEI